ncbi:MAG: membrane export protein, partial [Microscillaceae bacterium]|nr:membrane export protein [Microscillaceae bacterium]
MGIIIRQSTRSSLISFAGIGISAFTILWLYPRYLTREQIGMLTFLEAAAWTFLSFGSLGVFNIADRFFPYFRQSQDARHN